MLALDLAQLDPNPLDQFRRWFEEARTGGAFEPEAMTLATATGAGVPSARMVLMKGFDESGLAFFTNYSSRKATELAENPVAALLFHWPELGRQVRIEGDVAKLGREETVAYAHSRSRGSQLSALASPQSRPIADRGWLEERVARLAREHEGTELPVSKDWGGYRLTPRAWEFWQHGTDRLHDRFRYERDEGERWTRQRLGP